MKFWMLYVEGGNPPVYKHSSIDAARTEAERLARINRGKKVYVLTADRYVECADLKWVDFDDEVPF